MSKPVAKIVSRTEPQRECNENWHVFSPAGSETCVCGESTDNPLNKLAEEAKRYDL